MPNLFVTATKDGRFTILTRLLTNAGMVDTLSGSGPFTLFAPTDEAFGQLPLGLIDSLLQRDTKATLTSLLTLHVVAGKTMTDDLKHGQLMPTVNGQALQVDLQHQQIRVNNALVLATINASNGFIHVIDAVLSPLPHPVSDRLV